MELSETRVIAFQTLYTPINHWRYGIDLSLLLSFSYEDCMFSFYLSITPSTSISLHHSLYLHLSPSLPLSPSLYLLLSPHHSLYLFLSLSPHLSLYLLLSLSTSLSLSPASIS